MNIDELERKHNALELLAELLAEVKRLREIEKICHDDGLLCKECGVWWNIGYKHTEECSKGTYGVDTIGKEESE